MKKMLPLSLLLMIIGSADAVMKTKNELSDINVKALPALGAVSAVKLHGRVHEILEALEKALAAFDSGDCDLAQKHTKRAHNHAKRNSALTATSARSKVHTENAKAKTHKKYDEVKANNPHPDTKKGLVKGL
ncbi:MAG: hypothetical protein WD068_02655 [Candidatus Babeliales bacterium]